MSFVLVQKHYCESVPSHLLSSRISGGSDEAIEGGCYLITFRFSGDGFTTCFGPGLSGRKI